MLSVELTHLPFSERVGTEQTNEAIEGLKHRGRTLKCLWILQN